MTNEAIEIRKELQNLMAKYGYKSIRKLCKDSGVSAANLYSNITGTYKISIERMFKVANALGCDITEVIKIFHSDLYSENQNAKKVPVEEV